VDKPLAINIPELRQFVRWKNEARAILSSSGMRYAPEMAAVKERCAEIGEQRWITSITSKTWERYGIHALEPLYVELGPGFLSAETVFQPGSDIVHLKHRTGIQVSVAAIHDAYGKANGVNSFDTYSPDFMNHDLSRYLGADYKGRYPGDYLLRQHRPSMTLCHLVSTVEGRLANRAR